MSDLIFTSENELTSNKFNRALQKTFLSLRNRNFKLYFFGQLISNTGNWLTNVALTLLVLKITGSGLAVGLLAACQYGPILFLSPYGGAIADRYDKRKMLFVTQTLEMLQSVGLAICAFLPHPSLYALYTLAVIGGILLSLDNPLRRSFVSEMVPDEDLPNAVVLYSTIINTSRIFGPTLAGLLVVTLGFGWCFAVDAVSYLAVLFSLYQMRPGDLYKKHATDTMKRSVSAGIHYIRSHAVLWISFIMLALIGTLTYNFSVTLPLFVTDTLHSSNVIFTVIYSLFSFGAVVCSFIVAQRKAVKVRHVILGAFALGISMLILACVSIVPFAMVVAFFVGMSTILYTTSTTTIVQMRTNPEYRGRVLALQTVLLAGTTPIGAPLLGWLADHFGGRTPLLLGGVVSLIAALFGYLMLKRDPQLLTAEL